MCSKIIYKHFEQYKHIYTIKSQINNNINYKHREFIYLDIRAHPLILFYIVKYLTAKKKLKNQNAKNNEKFCM